MSDEGYIYGLCCPQLEAVSTIHPHQTHHHQLHIYILQLTSSYNYTAPSIYTIALTINPSRSLPGTPQTTTVTMGVTGTNVANTEPALPGLGIYDNGRIAENKPEHPPMPPSCRKGSPALPKFSSAGAALHHTPQLANLKGGMKVQEGETSGLGSSSSIKMPERWRGKKIVICCDGMCFSL